MKTPDPTAGRTPRPRRITTASRRPFTPRVTAVADRGNANAAPLEFAAETEPTPSVPERPPAVVHFAPATASPGHHGASVSRPSPRLLWLIVGLAAFAPVVWIALRNADRAETSQTAQPSPPPAVAQNEQVIVAAAMVGGPAAPAVVTIPVEKPSGTGREIDRRVARSRDASPAPVRRTREAVPTVPVAPAPAPAAPAFYGALVVDSEPSGARVFLNGQPVGSTPLVLEQVPVGSRVVRVEADAYEPWSSAIRIVANQQIRVAATLRR